MTAEKRNANVVIALIGALTVGASVLLWMEPRHATSGGAGRDALLMAENQQPVAQLTIAYAKSVVGLDRGRFDGIIHPDGNLEWESRSSNARVLVIGSGGSELNQDQAQRLIYLVRWLNEQRGLDLRNVSLERSSDARETRGLPGEARELTKLLLARDVIR